AGLEVLRIFNEPSAVALAFAHGQRIARKRVLVYDLGGGTFDATVVELTGDELETVATGGDNFLGGLDFDRAIAAELSRRLEEDEGLVLDPRGVAAQRIAAAAERAKIALSEKESTRIEVPGLLDMNGGQPVDLVFELTRAELETLTLPLVQRT